MRAVLKQIEWTELEGARVRDAHPQLQDLFYWCATYVWAKLGPATPIVVTSVRRPGSGVHATGRGLDWQVESNNRMATDHAVIGVLLDLRCLVNLQFPYRYVDGTPWYSMIYRQQTIAASAGSDTAHVKHVHLQYPADGWG